MAGLLDGLASLHSCFGLLLFLSQRKGVLGLELSTSWQLIVLVERVLVPCSDDPLFKCARLGTEDVRRDQALRLRIVLALSGFENSQVLGVSFCTSDVCNCEGVLSDAVLDMWGVSGLTASDVSDLVRLAIIVED